MEHKASRMRIAVVANTAWYLYNFRLNLMKALKAQGFQVVAVAPHDEYASRIQEAGIEFESVDISGSGTNPLVEAWSVLCLARVFWRHKIHVILSYTPKGNLYSALSGLAMGKRCIPNVSGLGRLFVQGGWAMQVALGLYRLTFKRMHHVFFQNEDDMRSFIEHGIVDRRKVERLPGSGVDLSRFQEVPLPSVALPGSTSFLLVARMLWDKGIQEYVDAARMLKLRWPQARFALLGFVDVDNPSAIARSQLQQWDDEGVVQYLGSTDDVQHFLRMADCVVLPSKYREGVPRSLLEAGAVGRPVITTDAPGCRDTVIDGVSGYLCRPGDAADLASKMSSFLGLSAEERACMGLRSREHIERRFDERIVLDRYLAVVQALDANA